MKMALVSPYDFAHPGGVSSHISSLERYMTRMGHEVKVIAPASREISDFGDRFIPIGKPYPIPSSESVIRVSISLRLGPVIKEVLARENFDIIHLHEPFMPMLCSAILRFSNTANVGTFHANQGKPGYNWGRPISSWMIRRRLHKLHGKIAVSKTAMNYASRYIPGPFEIIPNGIDIEQFSPGVPPIEEFCDGKKNILFLGRLEFRKGVNYLLKAYLQVKPELPNTRLIIAGPGTRLRKRYERWVRLHQLENDVIFVGFVPEADKPRYYQTADVFCAPATSRESFGIVLLEAMAMGKPVVATNIDGYSNVVSHGEDGFLVPPQNARELARALVHVLSDEEIGQQMAVKGRQKAMDHNWESITQRIFNFYEKVIDERLKD